MGDITVLEEIGLKEVSRKTYIEVKYLQLMINKDFAKLNRTNALGFVKIIKREYGISLDEWVKEFEEYHNANGEVGQDEQIFPDTRPSIWQNRTYIILFIVFVILLGGLFYTYFYSKDKNISEFNQTEVSNYVESPIIQEAVTNLENITNATANNEVEREVIDDKVTQNNDEESSVVSSTEQPNEVENSTTTKVEDTPLYEVATLKPKARIWVGVIDLKTFKRKAYLQDQNINIDLSKDQIITTGHGAFALENTNGNDVVFNAQSPKYLLVKNGTITEIKKSEFIKLNRDTTW